MSSASDDLLVVEEGTAGDTVAAAEPSLPPKSTNASGLSTTPRLQGQSGPSSRSLVTKCLQKARAAGSQCRLQWQFCIDLELPQSNAVQRCDER